MLDTRTALECVKLTDKWIDQLLSFFNVLEDNGDTLYFSPHPATEEAIGKLARHAGQDLYYLLVDRDRILGYGLLRGWEEGYEVPSLGIAIHPSVRGHGLGDVLMHFLHAVACQRGAKAVRLRVRRENERAIKMYIKLGYVFEAGGGRDSFLIGFKSLT